MCQEKQQVEQVERPSLWLEPISKQSSESLRLHRGWEQESSNNRFITAIRTGGNALCEKALSARMPKVLVAFRHEIFGK